MMKYFRFWEKIFIDLNSSSTPSALSILLNFSELHIPYVETFTKHRVIADITKNS